MTAAKRELVDAAWWLVAILATAGLLLSVLGCATPPNRVLTASNAYYYWIGEYEATCGGNAEPPRLIHDVTYCKGWYADLRAFKARIVAAEEANKRGGKLPLQLEAMRAAEKAARRAPK